MHAAMRCYACVTMGCCYGLLPCYHVTMRWLPWGVTMGCYHVLPCGVTMVWGGSMVPWCGVVTMVFRFIVIELDLSWDVCACVHAQAS
ncbi:hypothetical protein V8C86DRAFT_2827313 [Haematococcus lacustris]